MIIEPHSTELSWERLEFVYDGTKKKPICSYTDVFGIVRYPEVYGERTNAGSGYTAYVNIENGKAVNQYFSVALTEKERELLAGYEGREVTLGVRPEDVDEGGDISVCVYSNENLGMSTLVHGRLLQKDGTECAITCKLRGWCDYKAGDTVKVQFVKRHFFDRETTNAIRMEE